MKAQFFLLGVILFLTGCDFFSSFDYRVTNQSDYIITIRKDFLYDHKISISDSVQMIKPHETKQVAYEPGGVCGLNEHPRNRYAEQDTIPIIILLGDSLSLNHLRLFKYWNYTSKKRSGDYHLIITDELLNLDEKE